MGKVANRKRKELFAEVAEKDEKRKKPVPPVRRRYPMLKKIERMGCCQDWIEDMPALFIPCADCPKKDLTLPA